jgi:hypothetical protein
MWTGGCCSLENAPIIKLLISVHTPHKELRFCLDDKLRGRVLLELQDNKDSRENGVLDGACITSTVEIPVDSVLYPGTETVCFVACC